MTHAERIARLRRRRMPAGPGPGVILLRLALAFMLIIALAVGLMILSAAATVAGVYAYFAQDLPDASALEQTQQNEAFETVKIYDRTGQHLLYEVPDPRPFRGDRTYLRIDEIPQVLKDATIALEDRSFYQNPGVDPRGFARALVSTLSGSQVQGGSTITVQLIKNVLIPTEERSVLSINRKIKEYIMALEYSRRYSKDQFLEWYLNNNFYGNFAYGPEAAARVYFDKHAKDLTLAEAAMLAAIPQYPALNPINNPTKAKERQKKALDAMVAAGYITPQEAEAAFAEPLKVRQETEERFNFLDAPHFSLYVLDLLKKEYNTPQQPFFIWQRGLKVYTTLDLDLQKKAEEIARKHIAALKKEAEEKKLDRLVTNASVVAIRPQTGEILTMVGSLDYNDKSIDGEVNIALSDRQPGSSFKPYNYLTAFEQGTFTPATMVMDVRTVFLDPPNPPYVPENYDRKYHGPVSLRAALANSYNIPAVWLLNKVGVKNVVETAHRMGINTLNKDYYGLSLTLGGGEVRLLDHTYAFSAFANGGVLAGRRIPEEQQRPGYRKVDPVAILQVVDRDGNILYKYDHPDSERVTDERFAYLITNILSDNNARAPMFGLNSVLKLSDRPAAAKTGTTDDFKDNWTLGYTPQLAVGVWVGNAKGEAMGRVSGVAGAGPIWHDVMEYAHAQRKEPVLNFIEPPGLVWVTVCVPSGLLPTPDCQRRTKELFVIGTEPKINDTVYQAYEVNRETGKLATEYTPRELVERRIYEIYPPEAADWVREKGIPQPPRLYDDAYGPGPADPEVGIISPAPYSFVRGGVPIIGNARPGNFRSYKLEFGPGLNPPQWTQIGPEHYNAVGNAPLEYWDTTTLNGLYTLRLAVSQHDGNIRTAAVQVTVDNISPTVEILHPGDGDLYLMEQDEWVSITADATDDWAMDRVEFYMDNNLLGTHTVAPYSHRWTIVMSDTIPIAGQIISVTQVVTQPDGTLVLQEVRASEVFTQTDEAGGIRLIQRFLDGRAIISDTFGYTETHVIKVKAFDAAGNVQESRELRIWVMHEPKKKEQKTGALWREEPVALLPLDRWRQQGG